MPGLGRVCAAWTEATRPKTSELGSKAYRDFTSELLFACATWLSVVDHIVLHLLIDGKLFWCVIKSYFVIECKYLVPLAIIFYNLSH